MPKRKTTLNNQVCNLPPNQIHQIIIQMKILIFHTKMKPVAIKSTP